MFKKLKEQWFCDKLLQRNTYIPKKIVTNKK